MTREIEIRNVLIGRVGTSKDDPLDSGILTEAEVRAILLNFAEYRGDEGFTREEAIKVLEWAETAKLDATLLRLAMRGRLHLNVRRDDGEVTFSGEMSLSELRLSARDSGETNAETLRSGGQG